MQISTFTLNGVDVEMTYRNGFLAYTINHEGETYGYKVKVNSKKVMDVANATFLLLQNALETFETIKNNDSK